MTRTRLAALVAGGVTAFLVGVFLFALAIVLLAKALEALFPNG